MTNSKNPVAGLKHFPVKDSSIFMSLVQLECMEKNPFDYKLCAYIHTCLKYRRKIIGQKKGFYSTRFSMQDMNTEKNVSDKLIQGKSGKKVKSASAITQMWADNSMKHQHDIDTYRHQF